MSVGLVRSEAARYMRTPDREPARRPHPPQDHRGDHRRARGADPSRRLLLQDELQAATQDWLEPGVG
jgi:hypothetical protein